MMRLATWWRDWWNALHDDCTGLVDRVPERWVKPAIFLASALTLYVEMVMVRWHATCFHAFAVFKNVSLLSCFLGLGIGYAQAKSQRLKLAAFLPLLAFQTALFGLLSITGIGGHRVNPVAEQLVMGTAGSAWNWLDAVEGNAFLAAVFVLNAVMFIPLGQLAGRLMTRLPKIQSYSLNLLGSLVGIGIFFLLSLAWSPPSVWMGLAVLAVAPFLYLTGFSRDPIGERSPTGSRLNECGTGGPLAGLSVICVAVMAMTFGLAQRSFEYRYYTPYQVITHRLPRDEDRTPVTMIKVNHAFFQNIYDCDPAALARYPDVQKIADYYNLPYQLRPTPGDVCVVGAGTGNDVAAALRHQAQSVTAVEIDPVILRLGQRLHPERPYQDPRTHTEVNDARSFFRQTGQRFDTIVYGLLDSHTNLGALTNVRLDSFVYTVEGFHEAMACLKDDGLLIVSYAVLDPLQGDKLFAMLQAAWPDSQPRAFRGECGMTFIAGPGLARVATHFGDIQEVTPRFLASAHNAEVATDDWPFFYMQKRCYPLTYALTIGILFLLSAGLIRQQLGMPQLSASPQGVFFFLGAGFMLIETKTITELGLVFGNTWSVIAVVIVAILLLAYLANLWVWKRGPVAQGPAFILLGLTLLGGLAFSRLSAAGIAIPAPRLLLPIVLTLPLFFAGLIFSSALARKGEIGDALFANLLGAMLGGFLEYNSMYWGFSSLYPVGMALYGLAWLCSLRSSAAQVLTLPEEQPLKAAG